MWKALVLTALLAAPALPAGITLTTSDLQGFAGQTVTWTFTAVPDSSNYTTFTSSFLLFESNSSIGFYMDSIGALGGPVDFMLPPGSPNWSDSLGSFTIDSLAPAGAVNNATLRVLFETYSAIHCNAGSCFVSSGWEDLSVSVTIAPIPEPASAWLVLFGIGASVAASRRKPSGLRALAETQPSPRHCGQEGHHRPAPDDSMSCPR